MKLAKLALASTVAVSLLGAGTTARALIIPKPNETFTYSFTAAVGQSTSFNGSTVTIGLFGALDIPSVTGWDMIDSINGIDLKSGSGDESFAGTSEITSANASTFAGNFEIDLFHIAPLIQPAFWPGQTVIAPAIGEVLSEISFTGASDGTTFGTLNDNLGDPNGTWTGVPDGSSTLGLMAGAMGGLAAAGSALRRRK